MSLPAPARERADLLEILAKQRAFLRGTLDGMTEEQIRTTSTVSVLTLGGIVKHVTGVERRWQKFMQVGADAFADASPEQYMAQWRVEPEETVATVIDRYDHVASTTDEVLSTIDLDVEWALPEAPWFPPGAVWSVRRTALHILAETAQHCGHADIIREAIDGAKTMG